MSRVTVNRGERVTHWLGSIGAAAPCFYLSWVFFSVWADPSSRDSGSWVGYAAGLMMLEFVLLHSGAFMTWALQSRQRRSVRLVAFLALVAFYGLIAWVLARWSGSLSLLTIYAGVVAGRTIVAFTDQPAGPMLMLARSSVGATFYLLIIAAVVSLPVPEWGIHEQFLESFNAASQGPKLGEDAQTAVAWGAIYFLVSGLVELALFGYAGDPVRGGVRTGEISRKMFPAKRGSNSQRSR